MNEAVSDLNKIFTLKYITRDSRSWEAPSLRYLLSVAETETQEISREKFLSCYQRSIEHAWVLCRAALDDLDDLNVNREGGLESCALSLSQTQADIIHQRTPFETHRFGVVSSVLAEFLWHIQENGIGEYCITIPSSSDVPTRGNAGKEETQKGCERNLIIRSADFVRSRVESLEGASNGCSWVLKDFRGEDSFGWSQGFVKWGSGAIDDKNPPSFLTFEAFTDNRDGYVLLFLANKNKEIVWCNGKDGGCGDNIPAKFKKSIQEYVRKKCLFLHHDGGNDFALSVCCGTRFSYGSIGEGHTPRKGDELLGVFVTLIVQGVSKSDLKDIAKSIYSASGSIKYILLQNLAREKAHLQQQDQQALEKQAQMLRLLETPLKGLTQALENTQEETQQLRAILYDPHLSLFALAPNVRKYFDESQEISFGTLRPWKPVHEPGSIGSDDEPARLLKSLAAITLEIFGRGSASPSGESEFYGMANDLLVSDSSAYKKQRNILKQLLGFSKFNSALDVNLIKHAGMLLKEIMFTPFKPDEDKWPVLPLLIIFYDTTDDVEVTYKRVFFSSFADSVKYRKTAKGLCNLCNAGASMPLAAYSHLLQFFSGVLAYAKSHNPDKAKKVLSAVEIKVTEGFSVDIIFAYDLFNNNVLDVFKSMRTIIKNDNLHSAAAGDFKKPFCDLAFRCMKKSSVKINKKNQSITIKSKSYLLIITAKGDHLIVSWEKYLGGVND